MTKTDSVNTTENGPFKTGDKVFCHLSCYTEQGEVVGVWQMGKSWLVMVDHVVIEYAYAPYELSLVPKESNNKVVYVNFKTKRWLKETT